MLDPGTQVGRFRVLRLIAQGGMAEVYRAEQEMAPGIFRPAALKVIRPEYSESEDFREMFLDEARSACTLSHPNIVHIYEVGESDGLIYMGMELVSGESLSMVARTLAERGERLPDSALLAVGIFTCSALEAVHALELPGEGHVKLVHRDVSPHNLLLSAPGSLKLIDFGIAKAATNRNLTRTGVTKGKAGYFSPEQAMGKSLDGRSDLFSVGVTLYKLAAGVTPFDGYTNHQERNQALVAGRWESLEKVVPSLLPGFYEVVGKALQLKPQDRYANATEMREALEQVAVDAGINIGPSALAGFVEERNGQVSVATNITRMTGNVRVSGQHRRITPRSLPVLPPAPPPTRRVSRQVVIGISAACLLLLGGVGTLLLRGWVAPPPVVVAPVPVAPPAHPLTALPPGRQLPSMPPDEPAEHPSPPPIKPPATPLEPHRPKPVKAAVDEPIPAGRGHLRIASTPQAEVVVGGRHEATPANLELQSGVYQVELSVPSGTATPRKKVCSARVLPDKKARLIYDAKSDRCTFDYL